MSEKRKRMHCVKVRMNDAEYNRFIDKVDKSCQTQQSYLMAAVEGMKSATPEEMELLNNLNNTTKDVYRNIRGIGNNINQMAKHANESGYITSKDISEAQAEVQDMQKEVNTTWQCLRSLILSLRGTRH